MPLGHRFGPNREVRYAYGMPGLSPTGKIALTLIKEQVTAIRKERRHILLGALQICVD